MPIQTTNFTPIRRAAMAVVLVGVAGLFGCTDSAVVDGGAILACRSGHAASLGTGPLHLTRFASAEEAVRRIAAPWTDGRPVPRVLAASMPGDMADVHSTALRKRAFVAVVLPLALKANEAILDDRQFVQSVADCRAADEPLGAKARARLDSLDTAYGAKGDLDVLLRRVDIVPPSLVLAQAAIESGWGTSRFAQQGNALFGQRTGEPDAAMTPRELPDGTTVRVAAFPHLLDSVRAYARNLNTHVTYAEFRARRAAFRAAGETPTGIALAETLVAYSERGAAYVADVEDVIRHNDFDLLDGARLVEHPPRGEPGRDV